MIVDQAARITGFRFRQYAIQPTPAKPSNIIAHVDGSGTAPASVTVVERSVRLSDPYESTAFAYGNDL